MGDKRLYFDEDEKKQYYVDENGYRVYVENGGGKRDSSVKVAIISGIFAIIVAVIGILPLFPVDSPTGEKEFVPAVCLLFSTQFINSLFNCGNQTGTIEIAVAATLTALAPTPNVMETAIPQTLTALAPTETQVATVLPGATLTSAVRATNTAIGIPNFCAFLTTSQIASLQTVQDARLAIQQAEQFAGYRQNDYTANDQVPANVVIATNLYTTDFETVGVTPINNSGGYGLFLTTREITAQHPGTYWCVRNDFVGTPTSVQQAISLPSSENIPSGSRFSPEQSSNWGWVCSGDFDITAPQESIRSLYDVNETTGAIVILQPNNQVVLYARGNGYCEAYFPETRDIVENVFINNVLTLPNNCRGGCSSVSVIELDEAGNELSRRQVQ